MAEKSYGNVAIVYPGDHEIRNNATPDNNRLAQVFQALAAVGLHAEPAVYHDDFHEEVHRQLMQQDAVLVWMNPIQDGRDRSILDRMLRDVSASGVFVSTHPDVILKMGTKEVLYHPALGLGLRYPPVLQHGANAPRTVPPPCNRLGQSAQTVPGQRRVRRRGSNRRRPGFGCWDYMRVNASGTLSPAGHDPTAFVCHE